jgi:hypothetical protein
MLAIKIFLMIENCKDSTLFRLISQVANTETGDRLANVLRATPVATRLALAVGDKGRWGEAG